MPMEIVEARKFVDEEVVLDGHDYRNCTFSGCALVYSGGEFAFDNAMYFKGNRFIFTEAAARSLELFRRFGFVSKDSSYPFSVK